MIIIMKFLCQNLNIKLLFLLTILFTQIFISLLVYYFYPTDLITSQDQLIYNPTIFFSISFILIAAFISYRASCRFKLIFSGSLLAFGLLIFFVFFVFLSYYEGVFSSRVYVVKFLNYTFFHLGGFRQLIIYLFGLDMLGKLFYALNITLFLHMFGFLLGDLIYFVRNKYNEYIKKNNKKCFN